MALAPTPVHAASVYDRLLAARDTHGAGFVVLIDPDKLAPEDAPGFVERCVDAGVDALFLGGSLMHQGELERYVEILRA
ncbi:MAG: hypothetical protein AAFV01_16875, partial [Bacteroidota bacterium]